MNAVGIDVSKGKSMVAALRPMGEVALLPQEFLHTEVGLEQMAYAIVALGEDTRVIMEATGRYHEPIAAALHEYGICLRPQSVIHQAERRRLYPQGQNRQGRRHEDRQVWP